ncbi:hypothetical protein, partial [Mycolicibacillus koreensis]|uniref:hypothetical protein n=1 Tax=Mycolicibacillus koreensis TaxID=1069220 RepID=UPI001A9A1809
CVRQAGHPARKPLPFAGHFVSGHDRTGHPDCRTDPARIAERRSSQQHSSDITGCLSPEF